MRVLAFALPLCLLAATVQAQTVDIDFESAVEGIELSGNAEVRSEGGNPGGYLSVTDALNGQRGDIFFPDLSGNGVGRLVFSGRTGGANAAHHIDNISVTERADGFAIGADLRVGGGTDRPADGFSFNFARPNDPVFSGGEFAASPGGEANLPEEGTQTGLAIGFDEWDSGGGDVVGMSIRVDNELVEQIAFPTLNGAVDDITSLQTGPAAVDASELGWARLEIDVTGAMDGNFVGSTVQISYKGSEVFNNVIVPEPASASLLGLGSLMGLGLLRRRHK